MENRTIVALATAPGTSGLAVIRISGNESFNIIDNIFRGKKSISESKSHTIHYGKIMDADKIIDTVTVSVFKNPNSYTGEDVIEIGCHGGQIITSEIIELIIKNGAFYAEAGEFTKRAFLNGKLDLSQVEAVADIIHSVSVPGVQTAARQLDGNFSIKLSELRKKLLDASGLLELELDFAEEGLEFIDKEVISSKINETMSYCQELISSFKTAEIMRSGYFVGIVGYPNSGKSTLFNTMLSKRRAIVSDIPGTTRDYLEEFLYIKGLAIKIIDTAGLRETSDTIEIEGIKLVEHILSQSNMILVLNDINLGAENSDKLYHSIKEKYPESKVLLVNNKIDLIESKILSGDFNISAFTEDGISELKEFIYNSAVQSFERVNDVLINQRQMRLLQNANSALDSALNSLNNNYENEIIAIDIRTATKILGELTGESWNEEVLNHIFSHFCIGK